MVTAAALPRMAKEPPWMSIVRSELGVHETPGVSATARIQEYLRATTLPAALAVSDETAWCSAFACWVFEPVIGQPRFGFQSTRSASARSWCTWGVAVREPVVGAVVIFPRGMDPRQGHVGFVAGFDGAWVDVIAGNQGNQVSNRKFKRSLALGYRWPWIAPGKEFDAAT